MYRYKITAYIYVQIYLDMPTKFRYEMLLWTPAASLSDVLWICGYGDPWKGKHIFRTINNRLRTINTLFGYYLLERPGFTSRHASNPTNTVPEFLFNALSAVNLKVIFLFLTCVIHGNFLL